MEDGAPATQKIETDEESVVFLDPIQKDSSVKRKVLDKGIWIAGSGGCGKTVLVLRITEYSQLCDDYHPRYSKMLVKFSYLKLNLNNSRFFFDS